MNPILSRLCRYAALVFLGVGMVSPAHAAWDIVDHLNLAPFVPLVLDTLMTVASGAYDFFVGRGDGIIYILVWGFLGFTMGLYLIKLYIPKNWLAFLGFSGGGEMWDGSATGESIAQNLFRPALRAIIAATILLQIRPTFVTQWLVNPFFQVGAVYTDAVSRAVATPGERAPQMACPASVADAGWISEAGCRFLIQPVADLSHANNQVIKQGFDFINRGLGGLVTLIPHGGEDFLNIVTGIMLITAFFGCNLFMAMLIIQGIFNFGMALILYPFQVLMWVTGTKNTEKWFDIWPAFSGMVQALQKLIITMIACAFILCINVAVVRALFGWHSSIFVTAAGGTAVTNMPVATTSAGGFGAHSILWLSSILTFYLMAQIFNRTRAQLNKYAPGADALYNSVRGDATAVWKNARDWGKRVGTAMGWIKKK
ncbi:hypothetical protein HDR63_01960 [bacterium]|nr:hypothetical protein [bacterium]